MAPAVSARSKASKQDRGSVQSILEQLDAGLAQRLQSAVDKNPVLASKLTELRLRVHQPLTLHFAGGKRRRLSADNRLVTVGDSQLYKLAPRQFQDTLEALTRSSLYALEQELASGFLTLPGGHRVGLAGRVIEREGTLRLRDITFLNIRVARSLQGCADQLLQLLHDPGVGPEIHNTLIYSPPGGGKTTVLRELVRLLSTGEHPHLGSQHTVAVVDERSELAGGLDGVPQLDLGPNTDVLSGCSKHAGLLWMIRSMGPEVLVTDELGGRAEAQAIRLALRAGVRVLVTAHARDKDDLRQRPGLGALLSAKRFGRLVQLGDARRPGQVEAVYNRHGEKLRP